ncbi:protocatechuate dioxygenase, partial [Mesorhizobium sp. M6A.T.Ca.TU.002.02.2.1]
MPDNPSLFPLNRRRALGLIAVTAGGGIFLPAARAEEASPFAGLALFDSGAGVCAITPEATEG